jgi:8-oxo-dGTP pyrophosphatase MutT (NUDIX family)
VESAHCHGAFAHDEAIGHSGSVPYATPPPSGKLANSMPADAALPHEASPHQRTWLAAIDAYAGAFPAEHASVAHFREIMGGHSDAAERTRLEGHLTGSAWLVSADGERVLLTHHRKLNAWLQLGGHADGDTDLVRVALREAEEESGLRDLLVDPAIFDIDRHRIPARANEPAHWHYDVRYVVRATCSEEYIVGDESHALAWRAIAELVHEVGVDESVRRMAVKWLSRAGPRP